MHAHALRFAMAAALAIPMWMSPAHAEDADKAKTQQVAKVNELIKKDTQVGTGKEAVKGKGALVHYTGWLYDAAAPDNKGKRFDSSKDRGQPFGFPVGAGRVIRGWDEGVPGMKVGGHRTLIIPAEMGYGARGTPGGPIPPNAPLLFEVELVDVAE